jgi:hypothetical protein
MGRQSPGVPSALPPALQRILRAEILLPILVVLGYVAFVVSGFGSGLEMVQPLPIYLYSSLLLILLQLSLSSFRTVLRSLYGIGAALFGLIFAGEASFFPTTQGNFTRAALTYVIVNSIAVIVFFVDAVQRHQGRGGAGGAVGDVTPALRLYRTLAADFAGLAILFALSSFLLDFINTRSALRFLGVGAPGRPIAVNLNHLFGLGLPKMVRSLEGLNLALAFVMAAVWLLLIVVIGGLTSLSNQGQGILTHSSSQNPPFLTLLQAFGAIFVGGFREATYSLRSVLQIFLWLIPAYSIANFAIVSVGYFNVAARSHGNILDLFNPFSASSLGNIGRGIADLLLAVVAVAAVILTVVVAEFSAAIVRSTIDRVGSFLRIVSLTFIFFTLSLAVTNAASKLFGIDDATPFQVGAGTVVALALFGVNAVLATITDRAPGPSSPAKFQEAKGSS